MHAFLDGVRVLDLSRLLPGQYATALLVDLGAEVVTVEHPEYGKPSRHREPTVDGRGGAHLLRDQGKRSVAINLKDDRGREAFLDLAATADVVLEGFRPGTTDGLGIGFDDVATVSDGVVYCSLTGYGQDGPYADRPGHDLNYIGVGGLLALTGESDGPPVIPGYPVADLAGGLYATTAITAALAGRPDDGVHLDVSMTDVVASFSMTYADRLLGDGEPPRAGETVLTGAHPGYHVFEAADGAHLTVAALEERFWENLCQALDAPELFADHVDFGTAADPDQRSEVAAKLADRFAERPRDEWLGVLDDYDVPAGPVNGFEKVFEDPQLRSRHAFGTGSGDDEGWTIPELTFRHGFGSPPTERRAPAPACGADTVALLEDAGYDTTTVEDLATEGVIRTDVE